MLRGVSIKFCEVQTYRRLILYRLSAWLGIDTTDVGHIFLELFKPKAKTVTVIMCILTPGRQLLCRSTAS